MKNELVEYDICKTIARIEEIAETVKILDLINPTSKTTGLMAELLWRVKRLELEPYDITNEGIS